MKCTKHSDDRDARGRCRECARHASRRHKSTVPEWRRRDKYYRATYGIGLAEARSKLARQGGRCSICHVELDIASPQTNLDHCHVTGRLRDFLCSACNRGLGSFSDDAVRLYAAWQYIREFERLAGEPQEGP